MFTFYNFTSQNVQSNTSVYQIRPTLRSITVSRCRKDIGPLHVWRLFPTAWTTATRHHWQFVSTTVSTSYCLPLCSRHFADLQLRIYRKNVNCVWRLSPSTVIWRVSYHWPDSVRPMWQVTLGPATATEFSLTQVVSFTAIGRDYARIARFSTVILKFAKSLKSLISHHMVIRKHSVCG